ncbi:B-cell lymphoma 3 protein homolog [Anoplopoma fimbria]|uniref:B-cell lymphoma 3 protein homolog n=1 Tax=Anoplopoma fimbria TaxID=229290 RepID=UPI0023EAEFF8|nr:B-cell lymphoma 3 protein homolog [Anoplopoma fimbria]
MPRIMTMNGDHQSVATAPLDLRTTNRERGSAGSRSPDCKGRTKDARGTEGSAATPACTEKDRLEIHCPSARSAPGTDTGASRKRPADKSSCRLPFRKRPIHVEPEPETQTPKSPVSPVLSGDRVSPAVHTDLTLREGFAGRLERSASESRVDAAPVTLRRVEEAGHSPDGYPMRFLPQFDYGPYPVYCLPHVPELNHPLAHQAESLLTGIALATRQDEDGDTALHIAVVHEELALVCKLIQLLLLARRGLDVYNNLRQTPLHLAVITLQANMVEALLRDGADPAALDRNGQTALHLCCEYDQPHCLSVVLSHSQSSTCLESRNYEGLSPLHLAVLRGHIDLARMLLDAGADINAMDIKSGQSPLMHAVESNNADMVHFLIERGCDVNSQSYSRNTALHSACGRGQVDTVRLLLKSGADSSLKNYHNDTPVMVAKNKKIADVLRGRGSNQIRVQDQHCVSVSPHGSNFTDNGSPSPNHSRGCSPLTTPHTPHHSASHSPNTPSTLVFPFY